MIPKIIHYIWFGDQSKKPTERFNQWKKILIGWEFREWSEADLDVHSLAFSGVAYDSGLYGISIDPHRPAILEKYGGVWLDTDVDVYKDFSEFLDCSFLIGCRFTYALNVGLVGVEPNHPLMTESVRWYKEHWSKCTVAKENIILSSFTYNYFRNYLPEPTLQNIIRRKYGIITPVISKDFITPDGILRFKEPSILTTKSKTHPEDNYAHHLYESSWRRW